MADLMRTRRRIIANEPHIETSSGEFTTDIATSLVSCKINFTYSQSGSGTASPTNVRPITLPTSIQVAVNGSTNTMHIGDAYAKGYIDIVSGKKVITHFRYKVINPSELTIVELSTKYVQVKADLTKYDRPPAGRLTMGGAIISNVFSSATKETLLGHLTCNSRYITFNAPSSAGSTASAVYNWLVQNNVDFVYRIDGVVEYSGSGTNITARKGSNVITATAATATSVEVKYWTH